MSIFRIPEINSPGCFILMYKLSLNVAVLCVIPINLLLWGRFIFAVRIIRLQAIMSPYRVLSKT